MKDVLLVFIGGGLGSAIRLLINKIIPKTTVRNSTQEIVIASGTPSSLHLRICSKNIMLTTTPNIAINPTKLI